MKALINILFVFLITEAVPLFAQSNWELKKDKNGIKVYVKDVKNSPVLAYKISTNINAPLKAVFNQVIDFQENKKYVKTIEELNVLEKDPEKQVIVYMRYDMPWPFSDRDLVNKMKIIKQKNRIILQSNPANNMVEPRDNTVRLKKFYETWKLEKANKGKTQLFLQGHADPNVVFPGWIVNIFVVKEPYSLIHGIKTEAEKQEL